MSPSPGASGSPPSGRPPRYVVTGPVDGVVQAWSTVRLPFEPRGWLTDLRAELRRAVQALAGAAGEGHRLAATYTSLDQRSVDAENVLLYNIGMASFGWPKELRFERSFRAPPPPPVAVDGDHLHHHRYSAAAHWPPAAWSTRAVVGR